MCAGVNTALEPGVKVSRNATERRSGAGNLSLDRSGWKIIDSTAETFVPWAQQVSNLRYSNPVVNNNNNIRLLKIEKPQLNTEMLKVEVIHT